MPRLRAGIRHIREPLVALLLLAAACGDGDATPPSDGDAGPDAGAPDAELPDAGPTRALRLASTGAQIRLDQGLGLFPANLDDDVDVVAIHQEFYGLPWDEFESGAQPPAEWVAIMDDLVAQGAGKPIFLSLGLVGGPARRYLSDRVTVTGGTLGKEEAWSAECYDFDGAVDGAAKRAAYAAYVDWMVTRFDPAYVNIGVELNMFAGCGAAWDGMVATANAGYAAAKAAKPGVIAFPSFQLHFLYGYEDCPAGMTREQCYDANYAGIAALDRDRFAISAYPYGIEGISSPNDLPGDFFTRGADRGGERMVVAETGWLATNAVGTWTDGSCLTAIVSDPAEQAAYFDLVIAAAEDSGSDLVTWWANRDLIPTDLMTDCPCDFDASWCSLIDLFRSLGGSDPVAQFYGEMILKIFGSMGIRDWDGTPREPIFTRWQEVRAVPLAP